MASCSSPPKKRPKLSLKFMRKDRQAVTDDNGRDASSLTHRGSNGRTRHTSVSNGQSTAASSTSTQDPYTTSTPSSKSSQQEIARPPPVPFAGLQNLGNTCYLNSVLQALRFCPGFCQGLSRLTGLWEGLKEDTRAEEEGEGDDRREYGREMQFVVNLKKLYDTMSAKEVDFVANAPGCGDVSLSLSPDEVLESVRELNPMFQGFLQHDSQELLCCLLSYVLEACQNLKKRLVRSRPPSQHHTKGLNPLSDSTGPADNTTDDSVPDIKFAVASNTENPVRDNSPTNGKSVTSNGNSAAHTRKDSCGNGDTTPVVRNGKCTARCQARTPSGDSVASPKSTTVTCTDGKTNGNLTNGFGAHPRPADPDEENTPRHGNSERLANALNGTCRQPETSKTKRLGKYRHQTTLLSTFVPVNKEFVPPNGLMKDLNARMNGIDNDFKSSTKCSGVSNVPDSGRTDPPDRIESAKTVPVKNGRGETELECEPDVGMEAPEGLSVTEDRKKDCERSSGGPGSQTTSSSLEGELELIRGLFQGALVLRTRCNECESYTERREEFQDISLPVRSILRSTGDGERDGVSVAPADLSLSWAISEFACVERLTDENKYFCEHCRHHSEAERSMLFGELPPVLTIHLKRFSAFAGYLTADSTVSKVNDHLATPLSLRLSQWCAKQCKQLNCMYDLCAVVMHSGVSSSSGHYISYVQIPDWHEAAAKAREPRWGKFDDEKVSVLSQQEMASSVLHPVSSSGSAATPYLLFYRQVEEAD